MKKAVISVGCAIVLAITIVLIYYNVSLTAVSKDETTIDLVVEKGSTATSVISQLSDLGLIKSEFVTKIYIKLNNISDVKAGIYHFNKTMDVEELFRRLGKGSTINLDITIPEGKYLEQIAEIFASKTNNTKEELLSIWSNKEFVEDIINKYDFITEEILDKDIKYALEGYFFPSTYEFINKNVTGEDIAYKLLDEMEKRLNKYQDLIDESGFTIHEVLTFASIIQYEAILEEDYYKISGVFHNRLDIGMKLESCATLDYALGIHKVIYTFPDMATESPYNTYYVYGLPVGPGNMPSERAIKAVLNPDEHDYLFFLANVHDHNDPKTYYAKTYAEHLVNKDKYLK